MAEFRIKSTGEVVSQGELRRRNSNTSFPRVWNQSVYDLLGIDPVLASPQPTNTDPLKIVRRNGVEQDAKGNWVEKYEVVDMFSDTTDADGNAVTKASQEEAYLTKRTADQWKSVRVTRDEKLKNTDWVTIRAADTGVAVAEGWATYRQALRDITNQEDPFNITWPELPTE